MKDNKLNDKYSLETMLDKIDIIQRHDYSFNKDRCSEITSKQEEILKYLGLRSLLVVNEHLYI
jgi:hypothetical protein